MAKREIGFAVAILVLLTATPAAQAQFAVIDVASVTQLMSQVRTLEQQLATARNQLTQAQAEFDAMTGGRSMERLLGGTARNYLPPSWQSLESTLQGTGAPYPLLAKELGRVGKDVFLGGFWQRSPRRPPRNSRPSVNPRRCSRPSHARRSPTRAAASRPSSS